EGVLLARAAAVLHPAAQRLVAVRFAQLPHPGGRRLGQADHGGPGAARADAGLQLAHARPQDMLSAGLASSLIVEGAHGGSKTSSARAERTPSTWRMASSTQPGISPATGHPGAVRVISTATSRSSDRSTL